MGATKWTGKGPVHRYIVQQPSQSIRKTAKTTTTHKTNKNKTKTQTTQKHTQPKQTSKMESDRRSSLETNEGGEVITLYQLRYWYGRKQDKKRAHKHKHHIATPSSEWSNTALCGNQGSPQPGSPRSHRTSYKAWQLTRNKKNTSMLATTTPCSTWKLFFPSNAFMASARSFNTFNCMLLIRFH